MKEVREKCPNSIINIGSGTNSDNILELAKYADNFIVGTFFKDKNNEIVVEKVKQLKNKLASF